MNKSGGLKNPSQRQLRVAEQIQHLIASMLLRERNFHKSGISLANITVTDVNISPDLKNAKIYVTCSKVLNEIDIIESLNLLSYLFKKEIGRVLNLRYIPKLNFFYDNSLNEVERIKSLLSHEKIRADLNKDTKE